MPVMSAERFHRFDRGLAADRRDMALYDFSSRRQRRALRREQEQRANDRDDAGTSRAMK
jgi:hypothetical protein